MAELFGDYSMGQDLKTKETWGKLFRMDKYDVIVCTADVILDALVHAFIKMDEINLIVFDEAHHAYKQDTYARIMHHHYFQVDVQIRPKIFGMTASPLKADGDFQSAVAELEKTLDAKIFTASLALRRELEAIVGPTEEHVVEYKQSDQEFKQGQLRQLIEEKCRLLDQIDKPLNRMNFNDVEYGPLVSDLAWIGSSDEFQGRITRKMEQAGAVDANFDLLSEEWIRTKGVELMEEKATDEDEKKKKQKYVNDAAVNSAILEVVKNHPPIPDTVTVDSSNAKPKILKLIEVLEACGSNPILRQYFCGIMFVQRQQTAIALTELLKRVSSLKGWLKPDWITGHNSDYGEGMNPKLQAEKIRRFGKTGSTNLLIATTVAEEGLDISACNYVIRFDLFAHHVGYLQSKGRARHRNSVFIVLVEEGNPQHLKIIKKVNKVDRGIKEWLEKLPEESGALASIDCMEEDDNERADMGYEESTISSPVTGACLRPIDCVALVCAYVGSLSKDEFSPQNPEFFCKNEGKSFCVELRFPANAKIGIIEGPWCSSRKDARRMASFKACQQLYVLKELDEHLLPRKIKKVHRDPVAKVRDLVMSEFYQIERKTPEVYAKGIPINDTVDGFLTLHGVVIHTDAVPSENARRPIFFLLPSPTEGLPAVDLYLDSPSPRSVPATQQSVEIQLDAKQVEAACQYSHRIFCLLGRQDFKGDRLPYLALPMVSNWTTAMPLQANVIDWGEVFRTMEFDSMPSLKDHLGSLKDLNLAALQDVLLFRGRHAFHDLPYRATTIRNDLSPFSERHLRDNVPEEERESHFAFYVRIRKLVDVEPPPADEPLIEVNKVPLFRNLLRDFDKNAKFKLQKRLLIPSFTHVAACSASFYETCTLLPSILERYDQILLARELNKNFFNNCLTVQHLVEALTLSRTSHVFNYQKMEFYGDCFLKLLTCTWAFAKCHSHREGDLNWACEEVLSNKALRDVSLSKGIPQYAAGGRVTSRSWAPSLFESIRSNTEVGLAKKFSAKTVADLIESILGAALASSESVDLSKAILCARQLELLGPGFETDFQSFQRIHDEQVKSNEVDEKWSDRVDVGKLLRLQEQLGYNFKSPHLALEAVTHSSTTDTTLPSYERLEFLGDAILDFMVVSFFKVKYPDLDAGGATAIKHSAVSNASLAVLCMEIGLYRFLMHSNKPLGEAIASFREDLEERKKESEMNSNGNRIKAYWNKLKPPKVLADIAESMLGAVFVDSGFNMTVAKEFFDGNYKQHFDIYFHPDTSLVRTSSDFTQFIKTHDCTNWSVDIKQAQEGGPFLCSLHFHGITIALKKLRASRSDSLLNAKTALDDYSKQVEQRKEDANFLLNGSSLKAVLATCFPGNFARQSEEITMEKDGTTSIVDLFEQNTYANLHSLCNCKQLQFEMIQREEEQEEDPNKEELSEDEIL